MTLNTQWRWTRSNIGVILILASHIVNIAIAIDGDIAVWLIYKKRRMFLIFLKAAVSIYDAEHTAKTPHHILFI